MVITENELLVHLNFLSHHSQSPFPLPSGEYTVETLHNGHLGDTKKWPRVKQESMYWLTTKIIDRWEEGAVSGVSTGKKNKMASRWPRGDANLESEAHENCHFSSKIIGDSAD